MTVLHNLVSNKKLKNKMLFDDVSRITISFYKYFLIYNPKKLRDDWYINFKRFGILGRVYIAKEGINAQISIPINMYSRAKNFIRNYSNVLKDVWINIALDNRKAFWVLKMKVKNTILADHLSRNCYDLNYTGKYLNAIDVNIMLNQKDVIFLDIRNCYEYKIGHFKRAVNIPVNTFKMQLEEIIKFLKDEKEKKIVMYCTGGIRCEKASAFMLYNGFKNIYQIKGGIIGYVNSAKKYGIPIFFQGKNFVFDARISEKVSNHVLSKCSQCNEYCDFYKNCYNQSCHNLFLQCLKCSKKFENFCSKHCYYVSKMKSKIIQ